MQNCWIFFQVSKKHKINVLLMFSFQCMNILGNKTLYSILYFPLIFADIYLLSNGTAISNILKCIVVLFFKMRCSA